MKGVFGALVFAYAILSHAAVHDGTVVVQGLALATLATVVLIVPLAAGRRWAWASVPVVVAVIYLLVTFDAAPAVIALPAVLVPAFLCVVFGSTLRPGRTALITRIARAARPSLSDEIARHTRLLTWLWTLLFAAMVGTSLVLLLVGRMDWWSLQTNLLNYLACATLFVGDFFYRRARFPDEPHMGFVDYMRVASGYRQWM